jgi:spore coat polysaccharide biosynthesis predicted glycosyltransferase SpsG
MKKKVFFRTRGGGNYGWGNVVRLTAFASYCNSRENYDVIFFAEGPEDVHSYIRHRGFKVVKLPENITPEEEVKRLKEYSRPDIIIMEMLDCTYERQRALKKNTDTLVVFDDLLDHIYCADIVVCAQLLPSYGNSEISDNHTRFLTGFEYFLNRSEFNKYRLMEKNYKDKVTDIVVCLGGGGYAAGYIKTACALAMLQRNIRPVFISGYDNGSGLTQKIKSILPEAECHGAVADIDQYFWNADLAIVAGGYTKIETASTSTPSVLIAVQWHQIPLAEMFSRLTGMPYAGYMSFLYPSDIVSAVRMLDSVKTRESLGINAGKLIDGEGFSRVYREIFT